MHVEVQIPGAERIESLRSHVQRRLHSSIGQHADRVRRVSVRLSEFCGPARGSIWTFCRIEADDDSLPKALVAEAFEENPYRAFDKAIDRLSHWFDRELERPDRRTPDDSGFTKVESLAQRRRPRLEDRPFGGAEARDHGNPRSRSGSAMGRHHRCCVGAVSF